MRRTNSERIEDKQVLAKINIAAANKEKYHQIKELLKEYHNVNNCITYVMRDPFTGLYKIGETTNLPKRHHWLSHQLTRELDIELEWRGRDWPIHKNFVALGLERATNAHSYLPEPTEWYIYNEALEKFLFLMAEENLKHLNEEKYSAKFNKDITKNPELYNGPRRKVKRHNNRLRVSN